MSITTDRIARKANGIEVKTALDDSAKSYLCEALGSTLDSLVIGVIIVGEQGRILHANQAAQRMFAARSPVVSLAGCLCALQAELTKELRRAIATAREDASCVAGSGIGVPLVDKNMVAATAHVLPLSFGGRHASAAAAVFVTPAGAGLPAEIGTVARIFSLTPAETRLLQHLVAGAKSRGSGDGAWHQRGDGANAPQPHLHQDRRVASYRSPRSRHPPHPANSPPSLTLNRTV